MQRQNKVFKFVKDKSGSSMLFVLSIMLLLLIAGASTLVAASASVGAGTSKKISNQLDIYTDSMQKSIMYSLQTSGDDVGFNIASANTLGGRLMGVIYKKALAEFAASGQLEFYDSISLDAGHSFSDGTDLTGVFGANSITIEIDPSVVITPYEPQREEPEFDDDGNIIGNTTIAEKQQSALISATATVTVIAEQSGKSLTSVAVYDFFDGSVEDIAGGDGTDPDAMIIREAGDWEVVSYEKPGR